MAKILIIEDNPYDTRLMRTLLQREGHEVISASDGESGLTMARQHHPDMILVDIGLPDTDGQTIIARLRYDETIGHPVIITVTAWPSDTARMLAEAYGSDGYISKPFQVRTFAEKLRTFLPEGQ